MILVDVMLSDMSDDKKLKQLKKALRKKVNINATDKYGRSALFLAPTAKITEVLIKAGADVNIRSNTSCTALMVAKTTEQTRLLIEAKADVNARNEHNCTALMAALTAEQTKLLIEAKADVNARNDDGRTALFYATTLDQIRLLVEAGADINVVTKKNMTVLECMKQPEQKKFIKDIMKEADKEVSSKMNSSRDILTYELYELLLDYLVETIEPFNDFISERCKNYNTSEVLELIIVLMQNNIYTSRSYFKNKDFSPQRTLQPDRGELSLDDLLKARNSSNRTLEK